MSTYLPCRETISFYISNIIELPSLEQRTTTSTTTGYFWYVHVIYQGLQMYQKYKQTINCYLAADTDKSSHMCIYKNDQPNFSDQHIWFILFLGRKLWDRIGFFPLIMQMDQAFSSCQPRTICQNSITCFWPHQNSTPWPKTSRDQWLVFRSLSIIHLLMLWIKDSIDFFSFDNADGLGF